LKLAMPIFCFGSNKLKSIANAFGIEVNLGYREMVDVYNVIFFRSQRCIFIFCDVNMYKEEYMCFT